MLSSKLIVGVIGAVAVIGGSALVGASSLAAYAQSSDPSQVALPTGKVHGVEENGVIAFKGIPYAAPPVGELRWRVPQPPQPWQGTLEAVAFGPACMQADDIPKSEDCLTLNVWRPANLDGPAPVMFWIYGGVLAHGNTAQYPLQPIASQGVVPVSVNYRMGRLGFFAHPALAEEAPDDVQGNFGYMDQLAALNWVKENIAQFGGDPANVTVFGESAGGGSTLSQMISPMSQGLFARAIAQSPQIPGGRKVFLKQTPLADAEKMAVEYTRSLGIDADGAAALTALRAVPAETLVEGASSQEVLAGLNADQPVIGVAGSILDGKFMVETPEAAFAAGREAQVPFIIGSNTRDLGIGEAGSKEDLWALFGDKAGEAQAIYDPSGSASLASVKQEVLMDRTFTEQVRHLADQHARNGQPTWLYMFGYVAEAERERLPGTLHGFEIPYVLDAPAAIVGNKVTDEDIAMGRLASGYWASFGKTGDPNGGNRLEWPAHQAGDGQIFTFANDGVSAGPDPLKPRLDLWAAVRDAAQ